ncbi:MAG: DinB family protein [Anaerolineales bacterium]|nr:DinB family protein [Anaerolineales bacterium]
MSTIDSELFTNALRSLLDETFDNVQGYYLDRGTSFFETLADVSSAEASIPVGGKCATLAAQVKHVAFYLDVVDKSVREGNRRVDWGEIWRTVSVVSPEEWEAIKAELRASYDRILQLIDDMPAWTSEAQIGGAIGVIVHTAYHLGEVRQALCTLKP